ncbi:MAG: hypothetical protein NEHIOOID_00248 [Holosporales bacterium]
MLKFLQIFRTPKIGPKTYFKLLKQHHHDPDQILDFLRDRGYTTPTFAHIEKEYDALVKMGGAILSFHETDYPPLLKHIIDPPPFLTYFGNKELFEKKALAIVGARNASHLGQKFIYQTAQELGENGFVIASGLARGIDTAAHKGALKTGTIAVLAGGIDQLYPLENKGLYESIKQDGIVLSEMPLGTAPSTQLFARRNRIISGLSRGIIVMEAARHSGSMITADFALQQGREVFAVPGFPGDPRSHGAHFLIQQGAHLLNTVQDALQVIEQLPELEHEIKIQKKPERILIKPLTEAPIRQEPTHTLLDALSDKPVAIEDLLNQHPHMHLCDLMNQLIQWELEGKIELKDQKVIRIF